MRGSLFVSLALLSTMACGDIARTKVDLRFPDEDTRQSTQQLLFVVREPPASGEPCDPLWGQPPSGLGERSHLINYPNAADVLAANVPSGKYTVFFYALPARLDVLCDGDDACTASAVGPRCRAIAGGQRACLPPNGVIEPIAGGCSGAVISEGQLGNVTVAMEPPP